MQICARQLGMERFDEMAFKEKVKSITVEAVAKEKVKEKAKEKAKENEKESEHHILFQ